jgi:predicted dehydrogenase
MGGRFTAAIVGCGTIGRSHAEGCRLADEVALVAAVDPVEAVRTQFAEEFAVPHTYSTTEELFADQVPDIVIVCTWHMIHHEGTVAAAEAGVAAVICEKPMAIGLTSADAMIEACRANGTKLIVGHQRRFTAGWEKTRDLVGEGAIGRPLMVECCVASGFANWGTHVIDGARFVLGDPAAEWVMGAVQRITDRYERDVPIEDCCMALVQLESEIQLLIQSDLRLKGATAGGFLIRGSEGMLETNERCVRLLNATTGGWREHVLADGAGYGIGGQVHADQIVELTRWLEGGPEHRGSAAKARVTLEITMALYESARRNKVIRLPLEEGGYPLEHMIASGELEIEIPGRYDLRSFLRWTDADAAEYRRLRASGLEHYSVMQKLNAGG